MNMHAGNIVCVFPCLYSIYIYVCNTHSDIPASLWKGGVASLLQHPRGGWIGGQ